LFFVGRGDDCGNGGIEVVDLLVMMVVIMMLVVMLMMVMGRWLW
jgi:hypothetical protein